MIGTLASKRELCSGTWEYMFELSEHLEFQAGEYVFVTVQNLLKPDERGPRRHFSILSAPGEKNLKIATRIRDTGFKQTLNSLPIGGQVEVRGPYGDLILPENEQTPVVMIAGGIGITPFMSMLTYLRNTGKTTPVTLIYSNKSADTTAYLTELTNLDQELSHVTVVFCMTQDDTWTGEKGRIDAEKIQKYVPELSSTVFYIVGPGAMNQAVEDILATLKVPQNNIKREDFTGY